MKQEKIVVVGGGVAGWSVACALIRVFGSVGVRVVFIDNEEVDILGAEFAGAYIHDFNDMLGIPLLNLMRKTQSTLSYGVRIKNWGFSSQDLLLVESLFLNSEWDENLIEQYVSSKHHGLKINIDDLSIAATAARAGCFAFPEKTKSSPFSELQFGINLDLSGYAHLISQVALGAGVTHIKARVIGSGELQYNDALQSVILNSGQEIFADLFVDCSCDGDLVSKVLATPEISISCMPDHPWLTIGNAGLDTQFLPCAEWLGVGKGVFNIVPLNNKKIAAIYTSQDEVVTEPPGLLTGNVLYSRFYNGGNKCLTQFWKANVVAMGKAAYSLPITPWGEFKWLRNQLVRFVDLFGGAASIECCAKEYNRRSKEEYQSAKELVALTYLVGANGNKVYEEFFQITPLMQEAQHRLNLFLDNAKPPLSNNKVINKEQLHMFFLGSNILPRCNRAYSTANIRQENENLVQKRYAMCQSAVQKLPLYSEFMQRYLRDK